MRESINLIQCRIVAARVLKEATLADFATSDTNDISTFAELFQSQGLESVLSAPGPVQIFAPTDDAFDMFISQDLNVSLPEFLERGSLIEKLLAFHIVLGNTSSGTQETLLPGYSVCVDNGTVVDGLGNVGKITQEVKASNGDMFLVDRVLLPAFRELQILD